MLPPMTDVNVNLNLNLNWILNECSFYPSDAR
jgi:hypothetical protein